MRHVDYHQVMVTCIGPLATMSCEPRQARKGATVTVISGAGVWLVQVATRLARGGYALNNIPQAFNREA